MLQLNPLLILANWRKYTRKTVLIAALLVIPFLILFLLLSFLKSFNQKRADRQSQKDAARLDGIVKEKSDDWHEAAQDIDANRKNTS